MDAVATETPNVTTTSAIKVSGSFGFGSVEGVEFFFWTTPEAKYANVNLVAGYESVTIKAYNNVIAAIKDWLNKAGYGADAWVVKFAPTLAKRSLARVFPGYDGNNPGYDGNNYND